MPGTARRLRPTLTQSRATRYRRRGGPWDRGTLDGSLATGGRTAVVDGGGRLDASGLDEAVAAVAGALAVAGVRRGRVVSWQLPNGVAGVTLYRACWRLGAIAAPLHHRLGAAEMDGALDQVGPTVLIAARSMPSADRQGALGVPASSTVDDVLAAL